MSRTRVFVGSSLLVLLAALAIAQFTFDRVAQAQAKNAAQAPRFEVDPMWPKPMPNHWLLGNTIGVGIDSRDHVFIIHRGATLEEKEDVALGPVHAADARWTK